MNSKKNLQCYWRFLYLTKDSYDHAYRHEKHEVVTCRDTKETKRLPFVEVVHAQEEADKDTKVKAKTYTIPDRANADKCIPTSYKYSDSYRDRKIDEHGSHSSLLYILLLETKLIHPCSTKSLWIIPDKAKHITNDHTEKDCQIGYISK